MVDITMDVYNGYLQGMFPMDVSNGCLQRMFTMDMNSRGV